MENTSKNNYAKTCVLNVTADVKDGKNYVSDVYCVYHNYNYNLYNYLIL